MLKALDFSRSDISSHHWWRTGGGWFSRRIRQKNLGHRSGERAWQFAFTPTGSNTQSPAM